jgi:hypothetical protein
MKNNVAKIELQKINKIKKFFEGLFMIAFVS